jgi:GntR family transcriptional regulator
MMPMNLELDFRSGVPIYLQVVESIKERIVSGKISPGYQLPTVRSLALELRVNFNTIARAYRILDESGIISTQRGRGTYVTNMPSPEAAQKIKKDALEALTQRFLAEVDRLGASHEEVNRMLQEHLEKK